MRSFSRSVFLHIPGPSILGGMSHHLPMTYVIIEITATVIIQRPRKSVGARIEFVDHKVSESDSKYSYIISCYFDEIDYTCTYEEKDSNNKTIASLKTLSTYPSTSLYPSYPYSYRIC